MFFLCMLVHVSAPLRTERKPLGIYAQYFLLFMPLIIARLKVILFEAYNKAVQNAVYAY